MDLTRKLLIAMIIVVVVFITYLYSHDVDQYFAGNESCKVLTPYDFRFDIITGFFSVSTHENITVMCNDKDLLLYMFEHNETSHLMYLKGGVFGYYVENIAGYNPNGGCITCKKIQNFL